MSEILLIACNARFSHTALGLKCLRANLREFRQRSEYLEFTLQNDVTEAAYDIIAREPRIVACSVYIWNVNFFRSLVYILKTVAPAIKLCVGGPEIAEYARYVEDPLYKLADCLILGEGELEFYAFCSKVFSAQSHEHVVYAQAVEFAQVALPYDEYSAEELKHRILYVESSRACPFSCSFCLSANDKHMRFVDMDRFFEAMETLYLRGARAFKFLDRCLNADLGRALQILDFFAQKQDPSLSLHFEMVPHQIPDALVSALTAFPSSCIQIEFGVQSLNPVVARQIRRPLHCDQLLANLSRLRTQTHCHIHADLIAGLPGETWQSFAQGFDTLYSSGVQEIQLGILKRLKGAPISAQAHDLGLLFSDSAPYEILQTPHMSYAQIVRLGRMARYWEKIVNSGNFVQSSALLCTNHQSDSVFQNFIRFSDYVFAQTSTSQSIALTRWIELIFTYLCEILHMDAQSTALCILQDYLSQRKEDIPKVLRPHIPANFKLSSLKHSTKNKGHERQMRHAQHETPGS